MADLRNEGLIYTMAFENKEPAMNQKRRNIVTREPEVMSGELVFAGTRVPARTLVDYLEVGHSLDGFPTVSREQAAAYLRMTLEVAEGFAGVRPA